MKENQVYPSTLQGLFPGHPARHIQLKTIHDFDSGQKDTITLRFGAKEDLYTRHLNVQSYDGSWALGLMPGFPVEQKRWFVSWVGFDFDKNGLKEVLPFVNALEERKIHVYLTKGTTGRGGSGAHGYVFLTDPVSQPKVCNALKHLADLAQELGLGRPDIKPSNPYGPGTGILLPYRGAEQDGYGFNPLIDPTTSEIIPLEQAENWVVRTQPDSFLVPDSKTNKISNKPYSRASHIRVAENMDSSEAWEAELRRLKPQWTLSKRQFLTLGATAYGLVGLGLPCEKVKEDLLTLMKEVKDEEITTRRLDAIKNTINKYEKGESIAWVRWYRDAVVEAPRGKPGPSSKTLATLHELEYAAWGRSWKGKKGLSARATYFALIRVAKIHGVDHPEGVEVSISTRDLALEAGLTQKSAINALKTLYGDLWVERSKKGTVSKSGSLMLLTEGLTGKDNALCLPIDREIVSDLELPLRVRWVGMAKLSEAILEALLKFGPLGRGDLAKLLWRKSKDLKRLLYELEQRELVVPSEGNYLIPDNFCEVLRRELEIDSTLASERADIQRYECQRETQQMYLNISTKTDDVRNEAA